MYSVVIPLYNKADYVNKAIESVLSQTFRDFELIVVNDGSTDRGLEIIIGISDNRVQIIDQPNQGVSIARNNGVKHAKFNYVAFLDADDWWSECFLEDMNTLITEFPEAGLYGSSYQIVKHGIHKPAQIGLDENFHQGYIDYFNVYAKTFWVPINCSFVIVRKSVFQQENGFNPALKFGEDFDLWARIALNWKVGYINKCLAYSNQDVDLTNRALGNNKLWARSEHVIFNLQQLETRQAELPVLKNLLDGLKVRSLIDYYLKDTYNSETSEILSMINWTTQPLIYRFIYTWPKVIVTTYFLVRSWGSAVKSFIIANTSSVINK